MITQYCVSISVILINVRFVFMLLSYCVKGMPSMVRI